jgi:senataxin
MLRHYSAISSVLDIHADIFVAVAFAGAHSNPPWAEARVHARELVASALAKDVQDVSTAIIQLCRILACRDANLSVLAIREPLWKKVYKTMQTNDADGIATIISIVARSAHLDQLNKKAFTASVQVSSIPGKAFESVGAMLDTVNRSLAIIQGSFLDALSKYANYNVSSSVLDLLRKPGVVKDVMVLMLSPVEDIQTAAQTLVGQAFDVDVRLDCFRALLENLPDAAFEGIFDFLDTFIQYAPIVPEACSLSKSLVRCLTDIIEVLCASHDGLLHNDQFLKSGEKFNPTVDLPRLWKLMSKSITVIFKRTPLWSAYFENEDMIVWMRDALIFGRDMLAQRRVMETVASIGSGQPSSLQAVNSRELSKVGKDMVNDLQDVLPELARWLRLTDEELLHQSFSLLQSLLDCFRESHVPPSPAGIAKLNRHIDDARKNDPTRPQTRLDSTRLSKLEDALASFDSDDEVQIVSHMMAPDHADNQISGVSKPKLVPLARGLQSQEDNLKPSTGIPRPPTSKLSTSRFFTDRDQQKLDADVSLPSLRKPQQVHLVDPSTSVKRRDPGPKNEGIKGNVQDWEAPSSESESEDDEPSQGGLAALGKFQRSPKVKKLTERRQVKMFDISTNSQSAVQARLGRRDDARKTALRLKPDISSLHRALLSWNYDHPGAEPPITGAAPSLVRVPDQFADHHEYLKVFKPLLLLECWSQIVRSKDQVQDTYECKVASRQYTDDWLDVDISISDNVKKDWYLVETDVVLLRHLDGKRCALGKTNNYKAMPWGIQASIRCYLRDGNIDPGLQINTTWRLSKVFR